MMATKQTSSSGGSLTDRIAKLVASEKEKESTSSQKRKLATLEAASDLESLTNFVVSLCEDPTKVLAFENNPQAEALAFGLSPNLAKVVASGYGYLNGLRQMAGAPNSTATVVIVVCVV
jgi:hypothetical protein